MNSSNNYEQTVFTEMSSALHSTAVTVQPIGSTYMADVKLLSDARELEDKMER